MNQRQAVCVGSGIDEKRPPADPPRLAPVAERFRLQAAGNPKRQAGTRAHDVVTLSVAAGTMIWDRRDVDAEPAPLPAGCPFFRAGKEGAYRAVTSWRVRKRSGSWRLHDARAQVHHHVHYCCNFGMALRATQPSPMRHGCTLPSRAVHLPLSRSAQLACLTGQAGLGTTPELQARSAAAAVRLLMLTGCRLSEMQKLWWERVNLEAGRGRWRIRTCDFSPVSPTKRTIPS